VVTITSHSQLLRWYNIIYVAVGDHIAHPWPLQPPLTVSAVLAADAA
jgi:hypothetical protein